MAPDRGGGPVKVCVVHGDGIGHEVVPAALDVLTAVLPALELVPAEAGWATYQQHGTALPDATLAAARACGAVVFGAASSPHYPVPRYTSPIVALRRALGTYANLRPARYLPVPTARDGVDLIVVRENTEDLYVGQEYAADTHATATKYISREATERCAVLAYELAVNTGRRRITIVTKANVLPQTDGLFRRVALDVASNYPEITTDELLVDTAAYWMVKDPLRFDMILTPNLYGDILSDMAAAWAGGLGMAPSLNLGEGVAIAEPVHGSAPDIQGRGIANPTALILAVAMMVRHHWGLFEEAACIEDAVRATLRDGHFTADVGGPGALGTSAFTQQVVARLRCRTAPA